jgi:prevent-host-death family protein
MEKTISAAEANRHFSQLLRSVREGDSFLVTAHGRPVAKIVPFDNDTTVRERLRSQPTVDIGPWTRDELYDETL